VGTAFRKAESLLKKRLEKNDERATEKGIGLAQGSWRGPVSKKVKALTLKSLSGQNDNVTQEMNEP